MKNVVEDGRKHVRETGETYAECRFSCYCESGTATQIGEKKEVERKLSDTLQNDPHT